MTVGRHNLARLGEEAFDRHGDHPAVLFEGRWLNSGELRDRTARLATGFQELGIEAGDRVVVMMANCPEVGMSYGALWRSGAVITPAIFLLPPPEVRHILVDSGARTIITTPEFLPNVRIAAEGVETLKWIVSHGPEENGVISLEDLERGEPGEIVERADSDLAALMYTGGTTGRAKGVMLSHENLWACGKASQERSRVPGITRTIIPLPLSHAFGLIVTISGLHAVERQDAILMRWFEAEALLRLVQEHRVQRAVAVPAMLQLLLGMPLEQYDLSSLRIVNAGAAPLAVEVVHEFERRVSGVEVLEGYGLTESGAVATVNPPGARKLGSVGPPIDGYEVKVADDEGREVARGEVGELCFRSTGVMLGYWNDPESTVEALRDGWLHTGDLGRVDEDGYVWIVDRKKDLIIRGGFNVFPRDVEDALLEHPSVAMAGVVGKADAEHGEEVVAFVSLHPGQEASPEELVEFAKKRLSAVSYPREVRLVPQVPLTPIGKVDRKALRMLLVSKGSAG